MGASSGGSFTLSGGFWGGAGSGGCTAITINPATLPNGQIGQPYSQQLTQTGGAGTAAWSLCAGALPNNLTLNATTGLLSGTPTASGIFNFTARATASGCFGERAYTLVIGTCPVIIITPGSLPAGTVGTAYNQTLTATGGTPSYSFSLSAGAFNTWLNSVNLIFDRELSIRLNLIANNTAVIYTSEPDPFTNGDNVALIDEVRDVLRDHIGSANYDLGIVFGTCSTACGGVAGLGAVCDNWALDGHGPRKGGSVVSFFPTVPVGNSVYLGVLAHEVGHMFGAFHSFNDRGTCGANRRANSAVEAGGGSTILAYPGICPPNNIVGGRELRFHAGSFAEITNYIVNLGGSCAVQVPTGNSVPTVNAGSDYNIPRNTPFTLTAIGNDADLVDVPNLSFCWEQIDAGGAAFGSPPYSDAGDPPTTTRPIFRPFPPVQISSRTFPSPTYILNNANVPPAIVGGYQTAENLPAVTRMLNFLCTVRDNRGGVNNDSVRLNVAGGAGPFLVTQPNTPITWVSNSSQAVGCSVNNTSVAPISCTNVKISLSTDGGNTFPITLVASTPNDGVETITVPSGISANAARVKIEAIGNIFFDISDANFTITPGNSCPAIGNLSQSIGSVGTNVMVTGANFTGVNGVKFANNVAAAFTLNNDMLLTTTVPGGAVTGPATISKLGCPDVQTGIFTISPQPGSVLAVDDGTFEGGFGYGSNVPIAFAVNRLTPCSYPATLTSVSIFFVSNSNFHAGTNFTIVVGANADGDANIDNAAFQTTNAVVQAVGQFNFYQAPNLTINSGDFVVGFSYTPADNVVPVSIDGTPPSQGRSYLSTDGPSFTAYNSLGPGFDGDFGIRARVFQGAVNCPGVTGISPANGASGSSVTIGGANFIGISAVKFANNVPTTFTVLSDTQIIATVPSNATTGSITISKGGCPDAQTAIFTVASCADPINPPGQSFAPEGGSGSVSVTAPAVCAWTVVSNDSWITITSGRCGSAERVQPQLQRQPDRAQPVHGGLGPDGAFKIYSHASTHFIVDITGYYAPPGQGGLYYHPLPAPVRLLDTRPGETACDAPGAPLADDGTRSVLAHRTCLGATIPATAKAIVGNATVVNFISTGFHWITLYPFGTAQPNASNLNFTANQIVPNAFVVGLSNDGRFNIYSHASTHFIVDVTGYFSEEPMDVNGAGLLYNALPTPVRLLDTRPGETGCDAPGVPLGNDATRTQTAQRTCFGVTIPSTAKAVVGNATVVNFISSGFHWITLYPFGASQPNASNLNFTENQIVPNAFVVGLSNDGKLNIYSHASTHLIIDLTGYFAP